MTARRRTLAERRADRRPTRFLGAKRRQSALARQQRERVPRTRPVPHPFELPYIGVRGD